MAEDKYYSSLSGDEIENRLIGGVLFNTDQELTTSQKARARANIGAGEGSTSFKILGFFATIDDLKEYLQTLPEVGDAYGISTNPTPTTELLSPDGTQRQFTLTETPWHIAVAEGETVLEPQTDYIYANGVITFTTAPAAGTDTIRVSWYDETAPYNVFVLDGVTQTWIDNGPLLSSSLIDDNDTLTTKTWSSSKINTEVSALSNEKQNKITANGILKGNGSGGVTPAVAGTDYLTTATSYSPVERITGDLPSNPYYITANDAGKTIVINWMQDKTLDRRLVLTLANSSQMPVGTEIAIAWLGWANSVTIAFQDNIRVSTPGNNVEPGLTVKLGGTGMAAIKKMFNTDGGGNDLWMLTGNVEVVT